MELELSNATEHLRGLTQSQGKDLHAEADLAQLNSLLVPIEAELAAGLSAPGLPTVFVLGPPRSGSTLTSQLLAATGSFGVTTNFVARFWRAPSLGFRLERALPFVATEASFNSVRGRTEGASEPHEFGYYWSSWFDLGQETHSVPPDQLAGIDVAGLKQSLASMERAAGKALMFKNNTWFTFQADWLARHLPKSVFVACTRDPFFVAQSIYTQRQRLGAMSEWWSVRPSTYPELAQLDPLEQVAGQAVDIHVEMEAALAGVPEARLIRADYGRVCAAPKGLIREIIIACRRLGDIAEPTDDIPETFAATDQITLPSEEAATLGRLVNERLASKQV